MDWVDHTSFIELRAPGVVTEENWVRVGELEAPLDRPVLLDYSGVVDVRVPLSFFVDSVRLLESLSVRIAVVAPQPFAFGIMRQAFQTAGIAEGKSLDVFHSREDALAWLLA